MKKFNLFVIALGISTFLSAQIINPCVDSLITWGWQTIGDGPMDPGGNCNPQVTNPQLVASYGGMVVPQCGLKMAQITTGGNSTVNAIETFAGVASGRITGLDSKTETFGSAMRQKFYVAAGQTISFNTLYATDDDQQFWNQNTYSDYSFFALTGNGLDTAFEIYSTQDLYNDCNSCSSGPYNINTVCLHQFALQWKVYSFTSTISDSITLTIGILNCGDNTGQSLLLIDNVSLSAPPLGVSANANQSIISVFPNPANEQIRITSNAQRDFQFELYSADGKLVKTETISESTDRVISVLDLAPGFYIYHITGEYPTTGPLVIAR